MRFLAVSLLALAACTAPKVQILDSRHPRQFGSSHDPGAINLTWGWDDLNGGVSSYLPDKDHLIGVRGDDAEAHAEALRQAGYKNVAVVEGDPGGAKLPGMTAKELAKRLDKGEELVVIDVRTPGEWERGVIDDALLFPTDQAPEYLGKLDPKDSYAIICAGGVRSGQFASYLISHGFTDVTNVTDGMMAWYRLDRE